MFKIHGSSFGFILIFINLNSSTWSQFIYQINHHFQAFSAGMWCPPFIYRINHSFLRHIVILSRAHRSSTWSTMVFWRIYSLFSWVHCSSTMVDSVDEQCTSHASTERLKTMVNLVDEQFTWLKSEYRSF